MQPRYSHLMAHTTVWLVLHLASCTSCSLVRRLHFAWLGGLITQRGVGKEDTKKRWRLGWGKGKLAPLLLHCRRASE